MITGFNTDIEFEGITYHVQTEDKGRSKPIILSLVYDGGTILASKRSPYDDLLRSNYSERILAERLSKQHLLICAAIRAGRIEDLKKMTAREAAASKTAVVEAATSSANLKAETSATPPPAETAAPPPPAETTVPTIERPRIEIRPPKPISISLTETEDEGKPIPRPLLPAEQDVSESGLIDEPIIEAVAIFDDENEIVLPDDAVAIIEEPGFADSPDHNKLSIEILGNIRFKGGERSTVGFMVSRGSHRRIVSGAQIMVKILGSSFRPVIFHAATDQNGVATVNMQMPTFTSGRAAFLVRAISDGEEVELRRSIAHG